MAPSWCCPSQTLPLRTTHCIPWGTALDCPPCLWSSGPLSSTGGPLPSYSSSRILASPHLPLKVSLPLLSLPQATPVWRSGVGNMGLYAHTGCPFQAGSWLYVSWFLLWYGLGQEEMEFRIPETSQRERKVHRKPSLFKKKIFFYLFIGQR